MMIVVIEDNEILRKKEVEWIENTLDKEVFDYKICEFDDYTDELKKIVKTPEFKIYVIDIELPNSSGIYIAKTIRNYDDVSEIIICSSYDNLEYKVFKSKLKILDFVSKQFNTEEELMSLILEVLKKKSRKVLRINDRSAILFIIIKDILYIKKDKGTRNCIIKTINNTFIVNKTLEELKLMLTSSFLQVSRNCIVNQNNVIEYNFKDSKILFINNDEVNELSKNCIEKIGTK